VLLYADDRLAGSRDEVVAAGTAGALADLSQAPRAPLLELAEEATRRDADRLYGLCETLAARLGAALGRRRDAAPAPVAAETRA